MKNYFAVYYCSYPLSIVLVTLFFARVLYLAGRARAEVPGDPGWLSRLLVAGLCVIGAGYLALTMITNDSMPNLRLLLYMEIMKLGFGLILLGMVFTFDLLVLAVGRRGGTARLARSSELR